MCKMYMYLYAVVHYVSLFIGYRCCPCISHPRDLTLFLIWYKAGIDYATLLLQQCNKVAGNKSHKLSWEISVARNHICCVQHVAQNRPAVHSVQLCCHETSKLCRLLHATIFLRHTGRFVACNCCVQKSCLVYPCINIVCIKLQMYVLLNYVLILRLMSTK